MGASSSKMSLRERGIRQRLKDDFPHYADRCLKIRTKSGGIVPLRMNRAQLYVHERLEAQRLATGLIRALVLKGRQQGISTYVEGRLYWKTTHSKGQRAFILAHDNEATTNIFELAERYHENCPAKVKPHTGASSGKELSFDRLDSGYRVATAGSKAAGRSQTIQRFHGSEVAYWPNAENHLAGALQAVPREPGSEVVLESTSAGPAGLFWSMWQDAERGEGEYQAIFVPWFWQDEYRAPVPAGFTRTKEEENLASLHGLDAAQLAWRRLKIVELRGIARFRLEYPCTAQEAFEADAEGALWNRDNIARHRVAVAPDDLVLVVVAVDPQAVNKKTSAETGIVAVGRDRAGRYYVLTDDTIKAKPAEWGAAAVNSYDLHEANCIVIETNNGGDMAVHVLETVPRGEDQVPVTIRRVTASRGKHTRAEPISALYEQGRVSHVGHHPALENQLCTWVPGAESPDRLDALVWAISYLEHGGVPSPEDLDLDLGVGTSYWTGHDHGSAHDE